MRFDFACPWCGADTSVRGSQMAPWRFRIPCELCEREMVVTWDQGLSVGRVGDSLRRTDDDTVRIRIARVG